MTAPISYLRIFNGWDCPGVNARCPVAVDVVVGTMDDGPGVVGGCPVAVDVVAGTMDDGLGVVGGCPVAVPGGDDCWILSSIDKENRVGPSFSMCGNRKPSRWLYLYRAT